MIYILTKYSDLFAMVHTVRGQIFCHAGKYKLEKVRSIQ